MILRLSRGQSRDASPSNHFTGHDIEHRPHECDRISVLSLSRIEISIRSVSIE